MNDEDYSIEFLSGGPYMTNTYLLSSRNESILIDPGTDAGTIVKDLGLLKGGVSCIISTHGHFDHVVDAEELKDHLGCDFLIGKGENDVLEWSYKVAERYLGKPLSRISVDRYLKDADEISIGDVTLKVIALPGHTEGSIGLMFNDVMFTGDTLFKDSIGRTDFLGSPERMRMTLKKLKSITKDYRIFPGHGPQSTLFREFEYNFYLRD